MFNVTNTNFNKIKSKKTEHNNQIPSSKFNHLTTNIVKQHISKTISVRQPFERIATINFYYIILYICLWIWSMANMDVDGWCPLLLPFASPQHSITSILCEHCMHTKIQHAHTSHKHTHTTSLLHEATNIESIESMAWCFAFLAFQFGYMGKIH